MPDFSMDILTMDLAERICSTWRCIDESPRRPQLKAKIQVAIGRAIVDALIVTTEDELGPVGDRSRSS